MFRAVLVLPLVAAAFSPGLRAQSAVPDRISYQGRVTNANGTLIGAGTPVSRSVIFRVWKSGTGKTSSDLLYSEQQSANITDGEFSVLIGAGTRVTGSPLNFDESTKGNLAGAFDGQERYLGVTVDDGSPSTNDPELSPRQQIVTAAFAFRARFAESATTVGTGSNSTLTATTGGNIGIGTTNPGAKLEISNGSIGLQVIPGTLNGVANTSAVTLEISGDKTLGIWDDLNVSGNITAGGNGTFLGKVGIGTSSPNTTLDIRATTNPIITVGTGTGSSGAWGGLYFGNSGHGVIRSYNKSDGTGNDVGLFTTSGDVYLSGSGSSTTEHLVVKADGKVGIGTASPSKKLHVVGESYLNGNVGIGASTPSQKLHVEGNSYLNGNVGIGTASPSTKLHVEGTGDVEISVASTDVDTDTSTTTGDGRRWTMQSTGRGNTDNVGKFQIIDRTGAASRLTIDTSGNVGIGTTAPSKAKLQIAGNVTATSYFSDFKLVKHDNSDGKVYGATGQSSTNVKYSIYADGAIIAPEFHAANITTTSDERIKVIKGRSDARVDLSTLMGIEITDYRLKDVVQGKDRPQKKIIAQQVEKLFPQAISRRTDVVPDIYQLATVEASWIALATDLKKGDRVKLVTESEASVHEVMDVESGRFRTSLILSEGAVFVYGREVSDFRMVDYDAISMLNVSATQEIKREKDAEVAALREQNAALTTQVAELTKRLADVNQSVAALDAKDRARDAKLASIEKLLASGQIVMARPATTPRVGANGQE